MHSEQHVSCVRAFSLVEVALATAVFAFAVAGVLGLLAGLAGHATAQRESRVAQGLDDAIAVALRRVAAPDFDTLATSVPLATSPLPPGYALVATHDGMRVTARDSAPGVGDVLSAGEQFYLIECWRLPAGHLAYQSTGALLALQVRISWPYRVPGSADVVPLQSRTTVYSVASLTR